MCTCLLSMHSKRKTSEHIDTEDPRPKAVSPLLITPPLPALSSLLSLSIYLSPSLPLSLHSILSPSFSPNTLPLSSLSHTHSLTHACAHARTHTQILARTSIHTQKTSQDHQRGLLSLSRRFSSFLPPRPPSHSLYAPTHPHSSPILCP
jgi:hypothetical protein